MSFFWYSMTGGQEEWKLATASQRHKVITESKPAFVTVLDADKFPEDEWERGDYLKMKYSGPLYFDWDAEDVERAIHGFQAMLKKLEDDHSFDLQQARLFATGGRGFHLEIPLNCLLSKVPAGGIAQLPLIYRELALTLHTDALDLRVYSTRRGRMWRVPNIQRSNGAYKVPITVDEARAMTPELYAKLCAAPRLYRGKPEGDAPWLLDPRGEVIPPAAPEVNIGLQALFAAKRASVDGLIRRQAKARDDRAALSKFNGVMPLSAKEIMNGQHLNKDAGFNDIALQLAILGAEFGMDETNFIAACDGVIKSHSGDSSRYGTPRRRADALRERLAYVQSSNVYRFSLKALRAICDPDYAPSDLFGALIAEGARFAPELPAEQVKDHEIDPASLVNPEDVEAVRAAVENDTTGLQITPMGIFQLKAEGKNRLSDLAIFNPQIMQDASTGMLQGIRARVAKVADAEGRTPIKEAVFSAADFASRSSLDAAFQNYLSYYTGSDVGATVLRNILVDSAMRRESVQYTLSREGIDIIERPDQVGPDQTSTLAWVTKERVLLADDLEAAAGEDAKFVFRPRLSNQSNLKLDAHLFPLPQAGDTEFLTFMENLLRINSPQVVGPTLGWFVSCFHRMLHHRIHNEFPLLWMYGPAGSGKTSTPGLLFHLFTSRPPNSWITLQRGVTSYAWQTMMAQNTTAPLIVDEFKQRDFIQQRYGEIMSDFRSSYNCATMSRGGIHTGQAKATYRDVHDFERSAPIIVLSEAYTDETATQERAIPIAVRPTDADVEAWDYVNASDRHKYLTQVGALLIRRTLLLDMAEFEARWRTVRDEAKTKLIGLEKRPITNYAVAALGLDFLSESLLAGASLDMRQELGVLRDAIWSHASHQARVVPTKSEAIKTLQDMAYLTETLPVGDQFSIREGVEYAFVDGNLHIDMYKASVRYVAAAHHYKMQVYFDNGDVLIAGLSRLPAVLDDNCTASPLHTHQGSRVFSFSLKALAENGVQPFKGQPEYV